MNFREFVDEVIRVGIEGARADYVKPHQVEHLRGSIDGFELCRGVPPSELSLLLTATQQDATRRLLDQDRDAYWYWRCRAAEVEWTCNVVSAILVNEGHKPISPLYPTTRGVMCAAQILGELGPKTGV